MKHIKSYEQYLLESESAKAIEDRVNKIGEPQDKAAELEKDLEDKTGDLSKAEVKAGKSTDGGDDDKSKEMDAIKKDLSADKPSEPARQGYDDREDESIGARLGAEKDKKQSDKARREDSYGKWGKRGEEDRDGEKIDRANESEENVDETYEKKVQENPVLVGMAAQKALDDKHDTYDSRLVNMGLGVVLDKIKQKDPKAYADIEKYLEKNFKDLTTQDESWFTTMTA